MNQESPIVDVKTVTIASSGTTSGAADLNATTLVGLIMPAALTGTAMTFSVSHDGTTYRTLYSSAGSAISVTIAANYHIALDPINFLGVRYIKVVSGSAEGGDRTITLVCRGV